jgi:hypothetical protein
MTKYFVRLRRWFTESIMYFAQFCETVWNENVSSKSKVMAFKDRFQLEVKL